MLGWVLQPDWGENFFLSEGVEQSGEEASFAFHHRSAVTALAAPQSWVEQIPEGIAEHVEGVDGNRQGKTGKESQPWRHLHVFTSFPAEQTSPPRNRGWEPVSEEAQRRLASRQRLFIFYLTTSVGHGLALCSHDKKNLFRLPFCGNVNIWNLNLFLGFIPRSLLRFSAPQAIVLPSFFQKRQRIPRCLRRGSLLFLTELLDNLVL